MSYTPKRKSQRDKVLDILRARGRSGVTNFELNEICFRYGGRIFELRTQFGYDIETIREAGARRRYVLKPSFSLVDGPHEEGVFVDPDEAEPVEPTQERLF